MGAVDDYVKTGKISLKNMAANALTGTIKGLGMNSLQIGKGVFKSELGRKALNTAIGTGVGMGVDKVACDLQGEKYDPRASLVQNALQAAAGQAFGEPIDAASGSFLMTAHEFILPDVLVPIYLTRQYCNAALYSRRKKHFIFDSINTITAPSFR